MHSFFPLSRKDGPPGAQSFQPSYFVEKKYYRDGACLQSEGSADSSQQYKLFLLPPTCSAGFFLLPVFLGNGTTGRKESLKSCGNNFLCVRGCELESHFAPPSLLENNPFSSLSLSIIELFVRGSLLVLYPMMAFLPSNVVNCSFPQSVVDFIPQVSLLI